MYNNVIAKLTGQDIVKQEIMYRLYEHTNFVYEIVGETGSGKTTLINEIKNTWRAISEDVVLSLCAPNHIPADDYGVFNKLVIEKEQLTNSVKNILIESTKDIPFVGNSLSSITSELFEYQDKRKSSSFNETKEEIFLKKIQSYIDGKDVLILCYDFEKWDFRSRNLLINIISNNRIKRNSKNVYFLIESTENVFSEKIQEHKVFSLKNIEFDNVIEIFKIFSSEINLTSEQQKQLYYITNGNLDLLKECSSLPYISEQKIDIGNIIEQKIYKKTNSVTDVLNLLKQVAFIGQDVKAILLKHFSDLKEEQYEDALDISIKLEYLKEKSENISFVHTYLYNYYSRCFNNNRKYYYKLSKCLNLLYPSRYDIQFQYLFRGGIEQKAKIFLFLFLIQYYRENNAEYNIEQTIYKCLLDDDDFEVCNQICVAYKFYKIKQYDKAEEILDLIYDTRLEFRFEIHYLQALIATNKHNSTDKFQEQIDILLQYTTEDFRDNYPEMYIRNYMILVEFYAELNLKEFVRQCIKEINIFFTKHVNTDSQIACYEQCFKMKANAFYKIEIAYNYTKKANQFLKRDGFKNKYLSKYYISLLNHSANEIVLGEFEKAYKLLVEAHQLAISNPHLEYIHEDVLINNMVICGHVLGQYTMEECIKALEMISNKHSDAVATILIQSNLSIFYTINGDYDDAYLLLSKLYESMKYNDLIDVYYQYYITNNYGILLWLKNDNNALTILEKSYNLCPWTYDAAYFNARIDKIKSLIKNLEPEDVMASNNWMNYLYVQKPNTVGKAWKFWSSLMILSELQIWSDY